jgi:DNA-binding protein H-NS
MTELQALNEKRLELERQVADVARQIDALRQTERQKAVDQIRELIREHGISVADLTKGTEPKRQKAKSTAKVAAKFRDPATGKEWSGRGLLPKWLAAAVAAGRDREEFRVNPQG